MSHHRHYDYGRKPGSAEGHRRDKQRRLLGILLMLAIGCGVVGGLLYLILSP